MQRRKIRSVIVLSLVGAMISGLFGCSAAPSVKVSTMPSVQQTASGEASPLTAAYAEGKTTYELIEKAASDGQTAVLTPFRTVSSSAVRRRMKRMYIPPSIRRNRRLSD